MALIDFKLDAYDYLTFVIGVLVIIAFFYIMVTLGGLPGKLAEKRNHPHAESVKLGGWIGLFTIFPWIHALIWAYHDSLTVDVRKLPRGEGKDLQKGEMPGDDDPPEVSTEMPAKTEEQAAAITAVPAKDGPSA